MTGMFGRRRGGTPNVLRRFGRQAARFVPFLGAALLVKDAIDFAQCYDECRNEQECGDGSTSAT